MFSEPVSPPSEGLSALVQNVKEKWRERLNLRKQFQILTFRSQVLVTFLHFVRHKCNDDYQHYYYYFFCVCVCFSDHPESNTKKDSSLIALKMLSRDISSPKKSLTATFIHLRHTVHLI